MRKILFPLMLLLCSFVYGQLPTNGLLGSYEFTNGAYTDAANAVSFTQTGAVLTTVNDRYAVANNGLSLNGDYLTRSDVNFPNHSTFGSPYGQNGTVSFWIKTATNDNNERVIIDDSDRATLSSSTWTGYYIFLKNGSIGVSTRVLYNQGSIGYKGNTKITVPFVSDDAWHHVVMSIGNTYSSTGVTDFIRTRAEIFIDGVNYGRTEIEDAGPIGAVTLNRSHDNAGDFKIGNNRTNDLPIANRFQDEIDDLHIYSRQITAAEVTQLATINDFCFPPLATTISAANITENSAAISWIGQGTFDMAYVPKGQPFANAIIQTNVLQNAAGTLVHQMTSLQSSTIYNVYIRKLCSSSIYSSWSSTPVEVRTNGRMYVNENATGTNDGTSWANAFTNLQDAFTILQNDSEIWVAQGAYTPDALIRVNPFVINKANVKLYGGFNGTETTLSQRDFRANITILSGDIAGDDVNGANLADNSYHVLYISSNGANVDGFTISDGVANGTTTNTYGAGIFKTRPVNSLTVKNCIIKNNFAYYATGIAAEYQSAGGTLDIENCIFENNTGRFGTAIYAQTRGPGTFAFNVSNSLFNNNEAKDLSGVGTGHAGSAGFFQANFSGSVATVKLTNNTYVNNNDIGTNSAMSNLTRATVGANQPIGALNLEVANCIFYNNTITGGVKANSITGMNHISPPNTTVVNSIDEDGFSKLNAANLTNTSIADPLFTSTTDFTLQATSPAINKGDNSYLPATITTDLLGNDRISAGAIDAGVYEYQCAACLGVSINVAGNGSVTQSGTVYNDGDAVTLTATPIAGWIFEEWSGDVTGNTNPLTFTINSNMAVTATFSIEKIYVNENATGVNNGTSWADAYVDLQDAVTNVTSDGIIWIAAGTYKPGIAGNESFLFSTNNVKVYGGFNGTEVTLAERTLSNPTILSGDINGDDTVIGAGGIEQNPTTNNRADNSSVIVKIDGNNILLDGLVIANGHYNSSATGQGFGSAIYKDGAVTAMTLKNCEIIKNFNFNGGAVFATFSSGGNLTIENCKFDYNTGKYGSGAYVLSGSTQPLTVDITNSLFTNNISKNLNSNQKGFSGSSMWVRANGAGSNVTTTITNSTFAKNSDIGTRPSTVRGTVAVSRAGNSTHHVIVNNSIFYDNKGANNTTTKAIVQAHATFPNTVTITSTIDEDNFSNITSFVTNGSNSDPLFTDKANNDFTLQDGSPAIDTGDNTKIPSGVLTDLSGNQRIFNTTVDMGAYEYSVPLVQYLLTINVIGSGTVDVVSGTPYNTGEVVTLTASPNANYVVKDWTGDVVAGSVNSIQVTMDANKTITIEFETILGINDKNEIEELKIYPNPTKGNLTFKLGEEIETIDLYNTQGQLIQKFTTKQIDVSGVSNGMYLIKITTKSGKTALKKVIKN